MVHVIPVTFVAGNTEGKVTKTIRIVTDLSQASPQLSAYAVISSQTAGQRQVGSQISSEPVKSFFSWGTVLGIVRPTSVRRG